MMSVIGYFLFITFKRGFHPTQGTQRIEHTERNGTDAGMKERKERKERNEMTSLLDRPITAASDDGICRWHAAKLW